MPIVFENIIHGRIMNGLETLINNEFNIPIFYDEHKGNQSFLLIPTNDSMTEYGQNFETRQYNLEINYQLKIGGQYTKNTMLQISNVSERLKKLITNNSAYSPSNVYKWHDGNIQSIEYLREEDSLDLITAVMDFNCISTEVA
tara:strand:- start:3725 stop:4153 length:429 start_codon:yes stop_codon:yes gene_type:complete